MTGDDCADRHCRGRQQNRGGDRKRSRENHQRRSENRGERRRHPRVEQTAQHPREHHRKRGQEQRFQGPRCGKGSPQTFNDETDRQQRRSAPDEHLLPSRSGSGRGYRRRHVGAEAHPKRNPPMSAGFEFTEEAAIT
jgi:hypothetical protein